GQTERLGPEIPLHVRMFGLLELRQFHARPQVDFVQHFVQFGIGKALPPRDYSQSQTVQSAPGDTPRQKTVPDLIEERQKLFTMLDDTPAAVSGILHALKR